MLDYKNIEELIKENKQVIVIDLLDQVLGIEEVPYLTALLDPEPGLYVVGDIEPILKKSENYYLRSKLVVAPYNGTAMAGMVFYDQSPKVEDYAAIAQIKDDIVDENGRVVISHKDLRTKGKYFRQEPTLPAVAIKMAIVLVQNYLNSLCRDTHVRFVSYSVESLVKKEHMEMALSDEFIAAYSTLINKVMDFVDKDNWHIYYLKVKGTALIIEKTVDHRVLFYYEHMFAKQEETLEDHVLDCYRPK